MTCMQRAHRRHKPDGAIPFAANLTRDGHHALAKVDNFHKRLSHKKAQKDGSEFKLQLVWFVWQQPKG
jgi:hypothetical protein